MSNKTLKYIYLILIFIGIIIGYKMFYDSGARSIFQPIMLVLLPLASYILHRNLENSQEKDIKTFLGLEKITLFLLVIAFFLYILGKSVSDWSVGILLALLILSSFVFWATSILIGIVILLIEKIKKIANKNK